MKKLWKYLLAVNEHGYNLPEVLVVASIIGILATIPIASMRQAQVKSGEVQAIAALNMMAVAYESYNNETRPHRYPNYLQGGGTYENVIDFNTAGEIWEDLIRRRHIPKRYSAHEYNEPDLLAPGFQLSIFAFSVTPSFSASPRYSYGIGMFPFEGSRQPRAIAIFQGYNDGVMHISPRARKLPGTGEVSGAKLYTWKDF